MPATKKLKVSVTAVDIEHGEGRDCHGCPVAIAVDRALRGIQYNDNNFLVDVSYGALDGDGGIEITWCMDTLVHIHPWNLPDSVEEFEQDFDKWDDYRCRESDERYFADLVDDYKPERPEPFEFELELPEASHASD